MEFHEVPSFESTRPIEMTSELVIGGIDAVGPAAFGAIVAVSGGPGGEVIVVDGHGQDLRAFDRSGRSLWTRGGKGEGPGEFREIIGIAWSADDTIRVVDAGTRSISVLDGTGKFVDRVPLQVPAESSALRVSGILESGEVAVLGTVSGGDPAAFGAKRSSVTFIVFDRHGEVLASGPPMPGPTFVTLPADGGAAYFSYAMPMSTATQLAVSKNTISVSTQEAFEFWRLSATGRVSQIVRVHGPRHPVDVDANRAAGLLGGTLPDSLPAVGRIRVDAAERTWVEEYVPPYESRQATWWVFEPDGGVVRHASFPVGFTPEELSGTHALGVRTDSLGVQYVERWRLVW